jgi:DNA-binding transcriptional ArsR family regulator
MFLNYDDARPFPGLSRIGALLADPGRAAMLWALMDGTARPAGELTMIAGISPSAASGHFARLIESGLLALEVSGRHRYYRIATPDIAMAIEAIANLAQASAPLREPVEPHRQAPRPASAVPLDMRYARTCYDHLAGELAVRLFERMLASEWLEVVQVILHGTAPDSARPGPTSLDATARGIDAFSRLGIDLDKQKARRRRFACTCIDWSERRPHLGGALGAAFLDACREHGWLETTSRRRILRVTPSGERHFAQVFEDV